MRVLAYRCRAWLRGLWCRFWGWHTADGADWGYGMNGLVDLYCPNCLQLVKRVPLDDFPERDVILDVVEMAKGDE